MSNELDQCMIAITHNCNLRCSFCFAKEAGYSETDLIDFKDVKKIVDFCDDTQIKYIVLTGGEPTLHPDIIKIIEYINDKHKFATAMTSNGIILSNKKFCKKLAGAGLNYLDISIKWRNNFDDILINERECFAKQLNAIRNLSELGIEYTCSMVINEKNVDSFLEAIKNEVENGGKAFSFTFALDNEDSSVKGSEYLKIHNPQKLISKFISQADALDSITKNEWWVEYTFPLCAYTESQLNTLKGHLAGPCQIHKRNAITFDTTLNLLPCSMLLQNKIAKFGKDFNNYKQFNEMESDGKSLYTKTLNNLDMLPSNKCVDCQKLDECFGGCPIIWKNYSFKDLELFSN